MIICLEGPDGTGKTTLARELARRLNARYLHATNRYLDRVFNYHTALAMLALSRPGHVVLDRWWPSEVIYGELYRMARWPLSGRYLDRVLLRSGGGYVLCVPRPGDLEAFDPARHMPQDPKATQLAYSQLFFGLTAGESRLVAGTAAYEPMVSWPHALTYQIGDDVEGLVSMLYRRFSRVEALPDAGDNLLGDPRRATHVLVGERVNPRRRGVRWPFFEYGGCSLYLTRELVSLGVPEHKLVYVNAVAPRAEWTLLHLYRGWPSLRFVALGQVAARQLSRLGIPRRVALHPQAPRRFPFLRGKFHRQLEEALSAE